MTIDDGNGNQRITVSREILRAELGEQRAELEKQLVQLELRLTTSLASRADLENVRGDVEVLKKTALLKGGPFWDEIKGITRSIDIIRDKHDILDRSVLRRLDIEEIVEKQINETINKTNASLWTRRNRLIAIAMAIFAGGTLAFQILSVVVR